MPPLVQPIQVPIRRGMFWITEGFSLVFQSPIGWTSVMTLWLFFSILCSVFWGFGPVLFSLTLPIFFGGLMEGCRAVSQGQSMKIAHLFIGFNRKNPRIVGLGGVNVFWEIVLSLITLAWGGQNMSSFQGMVFDQNVNIEQLQVIIKDLTPMFLSLGLTQLILLILGWYAPALLIFTSMSTWQAMGFSAKACVINILPILLYLITMASILIAITITLFTVPLLGVFLGMFVIPTIIASVYVSYRDVFKEEIITDTQV